MKCFLQTGNSGETPHLLRSGRIDVALRTSLENLSVYALDSRGARRGRILSSYSDGWLKFTAAISMRCLYAFRLQFIW